MESEKIFQNIKRAWEREPDNISIYRDGLQLCQNENNHEWSKIIRSTLIKDLNSGKYDVWKDTLKFDAPVDFDAYMMYIELNRDKTFYLPRRKQLLPLVKSMQALEMGDLEILCISLPPRVGKALANDTPVLTRNGWKNHGDLVVGDEVIGADGKFKKVIAVHPKCMLDRLVEFSNGEKIQCHERHEWKFKDRHAGKVALRETCEWEKRGVENDIVGRGHRYFFNIDERPIIQGEKKELPVKPYTFGAWLGDGSNKSPRITGDKKDYAIVERIERDGYAKKNEYANAYTGAMSYDFEGLRKDLSKIGLCHSHKKTDKYIPTEYLTASVEQRLELLAGLIDTDGSYRKNEGRYSVTTCDEKLRDDIVALVNTFGWRTGVVEYEPRTSSSGVVGRNSYYVISFNPTVFIPCVLERKQNCDFRKKRRISVTAIRKVDAKEGNCITVEGDGMYLAGRSLIPTHNTTLAEFYSTWVAGRNPSDSILMSSHSKALLTDVYGEILRIIDPKGEYLYQDVFPTKIAKTNALDLKIDLGVARRFSNFQFGSIESQLAGRVNASRLLYCDDLIEGIEEALSKDRLDKKIRQYTVNLEQRREQSKSDGTFARELHIATRWSVNDVIGHIERREQGNGKAKFINVPALTDEQSNFDYKEGVGFSTETYLKLRADYESAGEIVSWNAIYMGEPVEREGLLYNYDELKRYDALPLGEPDAIVSVVDTKTTGIDFCFMPIAYVYGDDWYIEDCVLSDADENLIEEMLANKITTHKVQMVDFESNSAGSVIARNVSEKVKGSGCTVKSHHTQKNKETKIIINAPWVKEHCYFKMETSKEYENMLRALCSYTQKGKNKHDDVPDGFAQLSIFAQSRLNSKAVVMTRFF